MLEATHLHIEQQRIAERAQTINPFVIWDVGLGAAANAIAALQALRSPAELHSFDLSLDALHFVLEHKNDFSYLLPFESAISELLEKGNTQVGKVSWHFHFGDFRSTMRLPLPKPHSVIYDPYSPKTNLELWTLAHFQELRPLLQPNCLLTNYSRSTAVRVTLLLAGFFVGVGESIGEKAETTIFSPSLSDLQKPLPKEWLQRVLASRNSSPIRTSTYQLLPISQEDYDTLRQHPQFH